MSKLTRQQKKEEERRIVAEMQSALEEARGENAGSAQTEDNSATQPRSERTSRGRYGNDPTPERLHCKRCRTLMENGVCPTCGYRVYVPMDEKKRKKLRFIVACACIAVFAVMFVVLRIKG